VVVGSLIVTKEEDDDDDDDFRHMLVRWSDNQSVPIWTFLFIVRKFFSNQKKGFSLLTIAKPPPKQHTFSNYTKIVPSYVDFSRKDGNIIIGNFAYLIFQIAFPTCFSSSLVQTFKKDPTAFCSRSQKCQDSNQ
jgi:hypothetical protein